MSRSRRYSAQRALELLRDLPSDNSDGEEVSASEDDDVDSVHSNSAASISSESSSETDESNVASGSSLTQGRDTTSSIPTSSQVLKGKDGTSWRWGRVSQSRRGRIPSHNVFKARPGPTAYASSRIQPNSPASAFKLLFDEPMLRTIQKCTIAEGRRVTRNNSWSVSLEELDKFFGLIIARGVIGARTLPLKSLWNSEWGCPLFPKTMPRNRFLEILKYLRFDIKSDRRQRLAESKFALASDIWYPFIDNCQKSFVPDCFVTVDEQLMPCKARCKFIQFMCNKPDKFGIKFFLAVDVANKYIFNGFPYTGKDDTRALDISIATDTVMKLLSPVFKKGYHVTCDNYFTSLQLARKLLVENCSLLGTMRQNKRELPMEIRQKQDLFETTVFMTEENITLTSYQCKKSRSVLLLSSLHDSVAIPREQNPKKKPDTIHFYNKNKVAVDVIDQMLRKYSTRAASRRWPLHVLFNVLDMALSNSWTIYKTVCNSSISRRTFIQKVSEELTGHKPLVLDSSDDESELNLASDAPKSRKTCASMLCNKNRTTERCATCRKPVCGKCSIKKCPRC